MVVVLVAAAVTAVGTAFATETTINPAGDTLEITNKSFEITQDPSFGFGTTSISCERGIAKGTIPSPAKSVMALENFVFDDGSGKECTTSGMGGATFKVVSNAKEQHYKLEAVSKTSGRLTLPNREGSYNGLEFSDGKCMFSATAAQLSGTWINGKPGPRATPSYFEIVHQSIPLRGVPSP
jgi:hypothetical protein